MEDRWRAVAACRERTATMFDKTRRQEARSLCAACPVEEVCLWVSLRDEPVDDRFGMAGGMTPGERATLAGHLSPAVIHAACDASLAAWEVRSGRARIPSRLRRSPTAGSSAARASGTGPATGALPDAGELVAAAARAFGLSSEQICGPSRSPGVVEARHVAMHLLREIHALSCTAIGRQVGDRDHTTVKHALRQVQVRMAASPAHRGRVEQLLAELTGTQSTSPSPVAHPGDHVCAVVEEVGRQFGLTVEQLCGPSRSREVVKGRHVAMYVLRDALGLSYPAIGRALGGRDHTTVLRAVGQMRRSISRQGPIPAMDRVLARLAMARSTAA